MNTPEYLIVHHTGGTDADPKADTSNHTFTIVDEYHKSLGWGKIGYHYFIDKTGLLTQGRADNEEGAHTIGQNQKSLGICLAGNFDVTLPTAEQVATLKTLLLQKVIQYNIPNEKVVPHRFFSPKTCYGNRLIDTWAKDLLPTRDTKADIFKKIEELIKLVKSLP